jgi:hypothetical protein
MLALIDSIARRVAENRKEAATAPEGIATIRASAPVSSSCNLLPNPTTPKSPIGPFTSPNDDIANDGRASASDAGKLLQRHYLIAFL